MSDQDTIGRSRARDRPIDPTDRRERLARPQSPGRTGTGAAARSRGGRNRSRDAGRPTPTAAPATGAADGASAGDRTPDELPDRHRGEPAVGRGGRARPRRASPRSATRMPRRRAAAAGWRPGRRPGRRRRSGRRPGGRKRRRRRPGSAAAAVAGAAAAAASTPIEAVTDDDARSSSTRRRSSAAGAASARAGRSAATSWPCTSRPEAHPDRRARGPLAHRALRVAPGRRRQPDPRQHLPRPGPERAARAWRRRSSTSARRRTPCSTGATSSYDPEDIVEKGSTPRIEQMLKARQTILCQVTKNPIAHKGARLTQEVSLPGPLRRADPEQHDLRHLQAPARQRAQAPADDPRQGEARRTTA